MQNCIYSTSRKQAMIGAVELENGSAYWIENGNLILINSGKMDIYYDYIYQVEDEKFDLLAEGR